MIPSSIRFRQDIEWVSYEADSRWVARDPLNGHFYYFNEIERQAVRLLDGRRSAAEIISSLKQLSPGCAVTLEWLQVLVLRLGRSLLLLPNQPSAFAPTWSATDGTNVGLYRQLLRSPLSIRLPIWRPHGFTASFRRLGTILFHPVCVMCLLVLVPLCGLLVTYSVLSEPQRFLFDASKIQGDRWLWILVTYVFVKSMHELGHVLACAHWQADCKEIGILVLFLTPCLYCDTTECWKLRSKWQRAAVAAAGVYVEFWIACVATVVWFCTRDGLEHTLAASTLLMCSIGTVLINGNPFFKYDGYFIVSDLWGIPNLSQQASMAVRQLFVALLGGRKPEPADFDGSIWGLAVFAIVSSVYRWSVLALLGWLVWTLLVPNGLGFIAILILASLSLGVATSMLRSFGGLWLEFFTNQPIRKMRFALFVGILALLALLGVTLPIPNYVRARAVLDFADKSPVYAPQTGAIRFVSKADSDFVQGQILLELDCPETIAEFRKLETEIAFIEAKLALLKQSSVYEASATYEVPLTEEALMEMKSKRGLMLPEIESLTLRAPMDGFFLLTDARVPLAIASPRDRRLASHPTHPSSLGCLVDRGSLLGWFTQKKKVVFQTLVAEADIKSIRVGMEANGVLDSATVLPVRCKVTRISPEPVSELSAELVGDPMSVAKRNEKGVLQPETAHYQVTIEAETEVANKIKGSVATVFFRLDSKTVVEHAMRYLRNTFKTSSSTN